MIPIPATFYRYAVLAGVLTLLMLVLRPTRALLKFLFGLGVSLLKLLYHTASSFLHKAGGAIWRAHLTLFRNFLPRNAVIPSVVNTKTTKRL